MTDFNELAQTAAERAESRIAAERKAFENWQSSFYEEHRFNRDEEGHYTDLIIQSQWTAWFARSIRGAAA